MTCRGAELIASADVIVSDALVNTSLLCMAPDNAEIVFAGKRSKCHMIPQNELNQLLVDRAMSGKNVIRLKGGDPFIFGRGGEEAESLATSGVPFEIVPGVSSISAVPAYAGIPVTHRNQCSSISVITGHEQSDNTDRTIDWNYLAQEPGTKIILMGVERLRLITDMLLKNGLKSTTPAALIRWGTTGQHQTLVGELSNITQKAEQINFRSPAVIIFGSVVKLRKELNWFEVRPLLGQRVIVTRALTQSKKLKSLLSKQGAEVLDIPTIRLVEPDNKEPLKDVLLGLGSYQWLVFTSANGVDRFFSYFFKGFDDLRDLGGCRIAAVGSATASRLKAMHLRVDLMPVEFTARGIVKAFKESEEFSIENENVALLRAQVANPDLPKALESIGAIVDDVPVYKNVPECEDRFGNSLRLSEEGADWVIFSSSSAAKNFDNRFGLLQTCSKHKIKIVSIGPETTNTVMELGASPTVEAEFHTDSGLVDALCSFIKSS